jgi:hypothetical protein
MMSSKCLLLFLTIIGVASGSVSTPKAFLPRRSAVVETKKEIVGGEGGKVKPIDPDLAGKLLTGAFLIQGAALWLAPAQQLKFYGMKDTSSVTHALCSDFGSDMVATGILAYRSAVEKTDTNNAIGSAFLFLLVWTIMTLLMDRQGVIGANNAPIYARLVVFGLGAFGAFTDKEWASKLAFANTYFRLIDGIFTIFDPAKVGDTWGIQLNEAADIYMMRALGWSITWCSTAMVTLLSGVEAFKAVGYGSAVAAAYLFSQMFITKEWTKVGMSVGKNYAWIVFFLAILSGSFLL